MVWFVGLSFLDVYQWVGETHIMADHRVVFCAGYELFHVLHVHVQLEKYKTDNFG
jgi:hypothetical protein